MASLQARLAALIAAIGGDVKALQDRTPGYFGDGSDGAWTAQVTPTNVMANPNPDVNITGWNGFFTGGGANAGPTRVADTAFGGAFAFELVKTGATGAGVTLLYPGSTASFTGGLQNVIPGQMVEFSAQVKAQAGAFSSIKLLARWLKADGTLISEPEVPGAVQNAPVVGTPYSISGSMAAPEGAAYAGVEVLGTFGAAGSYTMRAANLASRPLMPGTTRSGAVYTLTRDVYFTDLVVNAGVTVNTHGYRMFCRGTLSGAGTISSNGQAPIGGRVGGVRAQPGTVPGGFGGTDGGLVNSAGADSVLGGTGHGGIGGSGGAGTGFAAGFGPFVPTPPDGGLRRAINDLLLPFYWNFNSAMWIAIGGGGGGVGGGGSASGTGGGGGGGGGIVVIAARTLAGTVTLEAKGGAGGAAGTNGGGGGGGAGGAIHLIYGDKSGWTGTTDVSGGAAGLKNGTGVNGTAGGAGNVIQLAAL